MVHLHLNPQTGLVLDPHSGARFRVNEAGQFLIRLWQNAHPPHDLVGAFAEEFDITQAAAERAIHAFHRQCTRAGISTPVVPEPEANLSSEVNPDAA